eukprot:1317303-Amphidinium_carterae.1
MMKSSVLRSKKSTLPSSQPIAVARGSNTPFSITCKPYEPRVFLTHVLRPDPAFRPAAFTQIARSPPSAKVSSTGREVQHGVVETVERLSAQSNSEGLTFNKFGIGRGKFQATVPP